MKKIKFRKLADKIRNEQWSDQRIKALESIFIYRRSDIKNLLKEIKAYRNDMVVHNYPYQKISDIITKWEMKPLERKEKLALLQDLFILGAAVIFVKSFIGT